MGFVLSAMIFLTSTGFLVNAAVAPAPTAAIASFPTPASSEGSGWLPQLSHEFSDEGTTPSASLRATVNNAPADERNSTNARD
ncbi:hypothetical protein AWB65_04083 [Caballeronia humi]|jgi:hypothetical protein|uniref:Secreted protein n=1 Tax=Caballeronia humi TaxID=326474 RepID=A0A158I1J3_9BURK|nr:hypothetical protein AWB65_04083 [Caballeronia humi]